MSREGWQRAARRAMAPKERESEPVLSIEALIDELTLRVRDLEREVELLRSDWYAQKGSDDPNIPF